MLISGSRGQWKETGGFKNSTTAWCHWPTSHQPPNNSISTSFTWWSHPPIDKQAEQSSAVPIFSNDPLRDVCFAFSHLPVLSSLFGGLKFLLVSGVWWLLWIICASHPLPALDWITLAKDVCKVTGARSPGAEPQGTAHSALILPERRGLSSGYPSWQAGLSKQGHTLPFFSLFGSLDAAVSHLLWAVCTVLRHKVCLNLG